MVDCLYISHSPLDCPLHEIRKHTTKLEHLCKGERIWNQWNLPVKVIDCSMFSSAWSKFPNSIQRFGPKKNPINHTPPLVPTTELTLSTLTLQRGADLLTLELWPLDDIFITFFSQGTCLGCKVSESKSTNVALKIFEKSLLLAKI